MILIVDDHIDTCRVLIQLLKIEGIAAECVNDSTAAVRRIEALHPELLVLDQMMPGLCGTDVLKALREIPSLDAIPVVFYSATTEGEREARQLGALDWVVKGMTGWNELKSRIVGVYHARAQKM